MNKVIADANHEIEPKNKTAIQYLIGTFLLSYGAWGIMVVANRVGNLKYGTPGGMILFLIGGFAPTIVSCICLIRQKEVMGFKQIVKDSFHFKQKPIVYGMLILFLGLSYVVHVFAGQVAILQPFYVAVLSIPAMMFGGGFEEVGWRYLLQPVMERKFSFVPATAMIGVIWALWHFPLFLIEGTNQNLHMSFPVFAVSVFGMAFVLAYLKNNSKGIWMCILFHSAMNALSASYAIKEAMLFTAITTVIEIAIVILLSYLKKKS